MVNDEGPEILVQAVIDAAVEQRWADVYRRMDPSDLPTWRARTLSMARFQEQQPGGDRVLSEWGVASVSELDALSDAELFARWMQAFSLAARMRVLAARPELIQPPAVRRVILGSVSESAALTHVLYRELVGERGSALRIATVRRRGDGWKLAIDLELLGTTSLHILPQQPPPEGARPRNA